MKNKARVDAQEIVNKLKTLLGLRRDNQLAERLGMTKATLSARIKRNSLPVDKIKILCTNSNIDYEELMSPSPPPQAGDFISIPLYDVHAAAGGGSIIETEHVKTMMNFSRSVLEDLNVPPKSLACLYVSGDSMEPTIRAGELVVIDTSDTTFAFDGGVYILRIDSTLLIKRLIRQSADEIEVVSDNKERFSFKISTKEIDGNYAIVGRVVLAWRKL